MSLRDKKDGNLIFVFRVQDAASDEPPVLLKHGDEGWGSIVTEARKLFPKAERIRFWTTITHVQTIDKNGVTRPESNAEALRALESCPSCIQEGRT